MNPLIPPACDRQGDFFCNFFREILARSNYFAYICSRKEEKGSDMDMLGMILVGCLTGLVFGIIGKREPKESVPKSKKKSSFCVGDPTGYC